jgi:hypothetical protein
MIRFRKTEWLLGAVIVLVAGTASTAAVAATTHLFSGVDRNGTIHGCFATNGGQLRIIDPGTASCRSGEQPLNWSQGGKVAANDPAVMTAHNPGTVTLPVAAKSGSTRTVAVADTITFTVPAGDSEQIEYFAWGSTAAHAVGCGAGTGGNDAEGESNFGISVDGVLPLGGLQQSASSSAVRTLLFGPGSHTVSLEVIEGVCRHGGPDSGTQSLSNSYLSTTVQATFTN